VRTWTNICHENLCEARASVAILTTDKINFKTNTKITLFTKGTIKQEDIMIVNIYAPNMGAPRYIKELITNIKKLIDSNKIIVGDLNSSHTSKNRSSKQQINKETVALNDILYQMDLDIFRKCHPKTGEYTFFSSEHGIFSRIDHILDQKKTNFNKFKKTKVIPCIFSAQNTETRNQQEKIWKQHKYREVK